jgi:hypothetical protein
MSEWLGNVGYRRDCRWNADSHPDCVVVRVYRARLQWPSGYSKVLAYTSNQHVCVRIFCFQATQQLDVGTGRRPAPSGAGRRLQRQRALPSPKARFWVSTIGLEPRRSAALTSIAIPRADDPSGTRRWAQSQTRVPR